MMRRKRVWKRIWRPRNRIMAFPQKRGLRRITVDDIVYRWGFACGELQGSLAIYGPNSSDRVLVIRSYQWFDIWLSYPFSLEAAPQIVTPALVRRAIEFGLSNGWEPSARGENLTFWYVGSEFRVGEPDAQSVAELRRAQFKPL